MLGRTKARSRRSRQALEAIERSEAVTTAMTAVCIPPSGARQSGRRGVRAGRVGAGADGVLDLLEADARPGDEVVCGLAVDPSQIRYLRAKRRPSAERCRSSTTPPDLEAAASARQREASLRYATHNTPRARATAAPSSRESSTRCPSSLVVPIRRNRVTSTIKDYDDDRRAFQAGAELCLGVLEVFTPRMGTGRLRDRSRDVVARDKQGHGGIRRDGRRRRSRALAA